MSTFGSYLADSVRVLQDCITSDLDHACNAAVATIVGQMSMGGPLLLCGNGGSASDSAHIAAELLGRFNRERLPYNAICLSSNLSFMTAWSNDYSFDMAFARQIEAYGRNGGVLLCLSTSGNSPNVVNAVRAAKSLMLPTIALTGAGGGLVGKEADIVIAVPSTSTPLVQQAHICVYHYICAKVEEQLAATATVS